AAPPETVPAAPPETVPAAPPETVPAAPPETVPAAPPETVPAAPPETVSWTPPETAPETASGAVPEAAPAVPGEASGGGHVLAKAGRPRRGLLRPAVVAPVAALLAVALLAVGVYALNRGPGARDQALTGQSASATAAGSPTEAPTGDLSLALATTDRPCHVGSWTNAVTDDLVVWIAVRGIARGTLSMGTNLRGIGVRLATGGVDGDIQYLKDDGALDYVTTFTDRPGVNYGWVELPAAKVTAARGRTIVVTAVIDPSGYVAEADERNNAKQITVDVPAELPDRGHYTDTACTISA
ncbi:hypothetical protein AB0J72_51660, partial [Dactylosporangium sp. NPDC049742]